MVGIFVSFLTCFNIKAGHNYLFQSVSVNMRKLGNVVGKRVRKKLSLFCCRGTSLYWLVL